MCLKLRLVKTKTKSLEIWEGKALLYLGVSMVRIGPVP